MMKGGYYFFSLPVLNLKCYHAILEKNIFVLLWKENEGRHKIKNIIKDVKVPVLNTT